ncbi:hypothetical protein RRG08_040417 [Elysia crispata]|uniref:Uncharacterized protein n=1 Tax=Elysia crispata TaxID=231223 RepID=A0AAE0ZCG1_9GAST|nr:hypothetical protein RRG08_040417 [Elysia crispata]
MGVGETKREHLALIRSSASEHQKVSKFYEKDYDSGIFVKSLARRTSRVGYQNVGKAECPRLGETVNYSCTQRDKRIKPALFSAKIGANVLLLYVVTYIQFALPDGGVIDVLEKIRRFHTMDGLYQATNRSAIRYKPLQIPYDHYGITSGG